MERLSEKLKRICSEFYMSAEERVSATADIDRLDHYEDLKDQGRLVVLPCAVGDIVYRIDAIRCEDCPHHDGKTPSWRFVCDQLRCPRQVVEERFDIRMLDAIGTSIFMSRPEAEASLAASGKEGE